MDLPKDPAMLLSVVNLKLRDFYPSLQELCSSLQVSEHDLRNRLAAIDYEYDAVRNQFI